MSLGKELDSSPTQMKAQKHSIQERITEQESRPLAETLPFLITANVRPRNNHQSFSRSTWNLNHIGFAFSFLFFLVSNEICIILQVGMLFYDQHCCLIKKKEETP